MKTTILYEVLPPPPPPPPIVKMVVLEMTPQEAGELKHLMGWDETIPTVLAAKKCDPMRVKILMHKIEDALSGIPTIPQT